MGDDADDLPPERVFRVLGDETRLATLRELSRAALESPGDPGLGYTALRERVGVSDAGNFNYHLDKLRDRFVTNVDGEYHLLAPGWAVVGALLAGAFERGERRRTEVDDACYVCGARLALTYERGRFTAGCENGHAVLTSLIPPGGAEDRPLAAVARLADLVTRNELDLAREGVCPNCYGPAETGVTEGVAVDYRYRAACQRCGYLLQAPPGMFLATHPAVVSFYDDHGVDVTDHRLWTLAVCEPGAVDAVADPPGYRVAVTLDDETLAVTLDADGAVVDATRERP